MTGVKKIKPQQNQINRVQKRDRLENEGQEVWEAGKGREKREEVEEKFVC